ncbi:pentatricopeptide repeat-containing protein At1g62910 [Ricinus communis]|uniref:pentatricopeptide repeat-containing protein At1g62910 n=1 Tax=Ricinus communis TaxID=3988 RepID=UPI00201A2592|nr:pentatricopeptide repeat-containing protein At1g62910 [Ricinus communis]
MFSKEKRKRKRNLICLYLLLKTISPFLSLAGVLMLSPYSQPPQILLQSSSLGNTSVFSKSYNGNCSKSPGSNLVFFPKLSLSTMIPADKKKVSFSYPKDISHLIHKQGIGLVEKHNGLRIKEQKQESVKFDAKASRLQVEKLLDAIRALPFKGRTEILDVFGKDGEIPSISDFNDLLMALVIANELDLALNMYSDVSTLGLVPDSWTFSIVIRCHCKRNDADEAKRVLDRMLENGLNPNVVTFTTLINSFCKKGKLQKAYEVIDVMNTIGCQPNVQTYNCLLKGLCYIGKVEEAYEILEDIKKSSIEPDIYTYTAMMDGFCKVGRSEEAMQLLNEAIEMGLTPNVVTFNTLIDGYSKEGRPLQGVGVLKKMKQRNCMPDIISYSTLLHGLLVWRKIKTALRIYEEMVRNGFEVDEKLMNSLLRGLCRKFLKDNELLNDAYQVFEKMKERTVVIHHSTYSLVIQAFSTGKKVDDALSNIHRMIKDGYVPRIITINTVIRAFCKEGRVDKALSILVLMFETRKFPSITSYDIMIRELNRQGMCRVASNVYGAALVRGVVPNQKPQQ